MEEVHANGQFDVELNVNYKIISSPKVLEKLSKLGIHIDQKVADSLVLADIRGAALDTGLITEADIDTLIESCAKEIFSDNKLGLAIIKGIRKFVPDPITADGVVKKGFLNKLSANGIKIPHITGDWGTDRNLKNLITNAGFAGIASRINGSGGEAAFTYIAVGTGATAANVTDTTLQTESATSGLSRAAASASRVTTTVTNDTAQLVLTFTVTGTVAVTESGVLNAASTGTLLCRQVFSAINVVNGDSLQITWKVKAS